MITRELGGSELRVSAIGLGCMGMSEWYGPTDDAESVATIHAALDAGLNFFDTADVYGNGRNETLLGQALQGKRDQAVVATKFGFLPSEQGVCGRPEYAVRACDASLRRLGVDRIDLYYLHRIDPEVPVEESVGAMAGLVAAGKVRYLGLSEVSAATLNRACRVHPIAALQSEYSIWAREVESILPACRELNVALVPYSPLGRGFLTGALRDRREFGDDDFRRRVPFFDEENFQANLNLVEELQRMAATRGCAPAQLALAWVLAQGGDVFPIPGTRRRKHLSENLGALQVVLTAEERARIDGLARKVRGTRKSAAAMKLVER